MMTSPARGGPAREAAGPGRAAPDATTRDAAGPGGAAPEATTRDAAGPGRAAPDATTHGRLLAFLDEVYRFNERINLTAVPREDAWPRHVEECAELLAAAPPPPGASLVDIGSGAGIPGVVLALLREDLRVVLVEADSRKAGFLLHVAGVLGLGRVSVERCRAETAGRRPELRDCFDVATSRATAAPAALCELALPLLRAGGELVAMVGDAATAAGECARAAGLCGGGRPRVAGPRLLRVAKVAPTPPAYPRRDGVPQRRPL